MLKPIVSPNFYIKETFIFLCTPLLFCIDCQAFISLRLKYIVSLCWWWCSLEAKALTLKLMHRLHSVWIRQYLFTLISSHTGAICELKRDRTLVSLPVFLQLYCIEVTIDKIWINTVLQTSMHVFLFGISLRALKALRLQRFVDRKKHRVSVTTYVVWTNKTDDWRHRPLTIILPCHVMVEIPSAAQKMAGKHVYLWRATVCFPLLPCCCFLGSPQW